MNSEETKDYLAHHGVMGMHWGIRRYQPYGEGGYNPKKKGKFTGDKKERKGLSDKQKKVLALAGVAAVAAIGTYAVVKTGAGKKALSALANAGKTIVAETKGNSEWFVNEGGSTASKAGSKTLRSVAKAMSDDELSKAISRLEKENKFVSLSSKDITNGKYFVEGLGIIGATAFATTLANKSGNKAAEAVVSGTLKKKLDPQVYKSIYPKK